MRFFTVVYSSINKTGGRYKGTTPVAAARKAATKLFAEIKTRKPISFTIRETTQNSKKKIYSYEARHIELETPIEFNGITITHRNEVKKIPLIF